ncbi:MAG: hypothetical protein RR766_04090 [Longicatena sp.]
MENKKKEPAPCKKCAAQKNCMDPHHCIKYLKWKRGTLAHL